MSTRCVTDLMAKQANRIYSPSSDVGFMPTSMTLWLLPLKGFAVDVTSP